jgi:hypothetical protein
MEGDAVRVVDVEVLLASVLCSTEGRREELGVGVRPDVIEGRGEDMVDIIR